MKIYKKISTFSTILGTKHNESVISYFEETVFKYSSMKRHALHVIRNNPEIKENFLNRYLQDKYGVTTRTANSCLKEVKGIVNSAVALLSLNIEKIENRIKDKRKELRKVIEDKSSPVTVSIIRKNGRYYLHVSITSQYTSETICTRKEYGTIGIDFNKGMLAIAETDQSGNLKNIFQRKFYFGKGGKTKAQLSKILSDICKYAIDKGKDIIIEDLKSFKKKKAKTNKAKTEHGREYNDMLHKLPYSTYSQLIEDMCFKRRISLIKINPYNTSKIAGQKFCKRMNLNIHNGAAYVIARRGMKIKDVYVKKAS